MTTHATLKADIEVFLHRDDLDAVIPTLVRLAEARIRKDVRVMAMENATTLTIDGQNGAAVPSGYLAMRRLYRDDPTRHELEYAPPNSFWSRPEAHIIGTPSLYTIEDDKFLFAPYPGETSYAKLLFYRAFDALSGDSDTNWLLTNHYDVYLYACLAEAKAFIEDDEQAGKWATAYSNAKESVNRNNQRAVRGLSMVRHSRVP